MNLKILNIYPYEKRCNNFCGPNLEANRNMSYPNLSPLAKDIVSFSGGEKLIQAAIENDYTSQLPMLRIMGEKLLKVLEECCQEVKGAVFDREYCEKALNKSLERYMEKFKDSGSVPLDRIRSTVFIKDLYDFSIITNYIKALEKRGFCISTIPEKTTGKKVLSWKHDFDIRLNDDENSLVTQEEIKKLPSHLREYISERQKSGYKDIQLRVVDASNLNKEQRIPKNLSKLIPQEIIFLFGRATADAKTDESKYVYNITRKLSKMHLLDYSYNGIHKIRENIQNIGSILRSNISKPLYRNAEIYDLKPNNSNLLEDVQLLEKQCNILKAHMTDLKTRTAKIYTRIRHMIFSPDYDIELEKMIKSTQEYKTRPNKRITDDEINIKRSELLIDLIEHRAEDMKTIAEQKCKLEETIQKYGIKDTDRKIQLEEKLTKLDQTIEKILSGKTTLDESEVAKLQNIQAKKNKIKKLLEALEN